MLPVRHPVAKYNPRTFVRVSDHWMQNSLPSGSCMTCQYSLP